MAPLLLMSFRVEIEDLSSEGEGVGSVDGLRCFIPGTLPGEVAEVELTEKRKSFAKGGLLKILKNSPDRVTPPCPYFSECGGCQIQHLSYEGQLKAKRKRVLDALTRIGKFQKPLVHETVPSPKPFHYRNKIQLPVECGKIGLFRKGTHDIIDIKECLIHEEIGESLYKKIREEICRFEEVRFLIIRSSIRRGELLVTLVLKKKPSPHLKAFAKKLTELYPHVKGVVASINPHETNVIIGKEFELLAGIGEIKEEILGLRFAVGPSSFFQVNPLQAEQLYKKAIALLKLNRETTLLDAYCGVGTLSLLGAREAKSVIGIEYVEEAVSNARENAKVNGLTNVEFFSGKVEDLILSLPKQDAVLLNPPRKGCAPAVLDALIKQKPSRIVYVSCDPATLARDLKILTGSGFELSELAPFDMFPQTAHVETVALLKVL